MAKKLPPASYKIPEVRAEIKSDIVKGTQNIKTKVIYRDTKTGRFVKGGFSKTVDFDTYQRVSFAREKGELSEKEFARAIFNSGRLDKRMEASKESLHEVLVRRYDLPYGIQQRLLETQSMITVAEFAKYYEKYGYQYNEIFDYKDRLKNPKSYSRKGDEEILSEFLNNMKEFVKNPEWHKQWKAWLK